MLFTAQFKNKRYVEAVSRKTGARRRITEGTNPVYLPTGHLVFARAGTLFAGPFDVRSLQLTASPVPVLEGVLITDSGAHFSVAQDGTLVYVPDIPESGRTVWVDRQGRSRPAFDEFRAFRHPRISPDGARVAVQIPDGVWIYEFGRGTRARLTAATDTTRAVWAPGARSLAMSRWIDGIPRVFLAPSDGSAEPELLVDSQGALVESWPLDGSPDGRALLVSKHDPQTALEVWAVEIAADRKFSAVLSNESIKEAARFSPDGRWIVYGAKQGQKQQQIYVQAFPPTAARWLISGDGGGMEPVWSPTGKEIFYRSTDGRRMMAVSVQGTSALLAGSPTALFESKHAFRDFYANYDVSRDGREFLMIEPQGARDPDRLVVVLNWFDELKRIVATR